MFAKVEISGIIRSMTGMHIGGSNQFSAIGAVDSPVIRDPYSDLPMIPGSSLKGKIRSLLAKQYNAELGIMSERADDDAPQILRLFGAGGKKPIKSRLIFSDMVLANADYLSSIDVPKTEIKFENYINRISAVANPRQIERSVRGAEYELRIIYNVDAPEEMVEDITLLSEGMQLLEYDYLGGHGSRGYGKVEFDDLKIECVIGKVDDSVMETCRTILKKV